MLLLQLTIGDAYGAGFEYVSNKIIRDFNTFSYRDHPRHKGLKAGRYTDDTQMSLAIAELLVEKKDWTPINIANKFVAVFKRDEREGYASRFYDFLQEVKTGEEFLQKIIPHSDKSGAAMRAPLLGLLSDPKELIEKTRIQAAITHDTPDGINAAIAAAFIPHFFIWERGKKENLAQYIDAKVKGDWLTPWKGKVGAKGWMSVKAAITAIEEAKSQADLLKKCIDYSGDVDTVAAIAMAGAAYCQELPHNLPTNLYQNLENDSYGKDYIKKLDKSLDKSLLELYPLG